MTVGGESVTPYELPGPQYRLTLYRRPVGQAGNGGKQLLLALDGGNGVFPAVPPLHPVRLHLLDAGSEALRCLAVLQDRSFITSRRLARHSLNECLPGREGVAGIQYPSGFPEVRI